MVVVAAIIGVMAAVALPSITGYIRIYRLRSGVQQVASEVQTARMKAISKNTNSGVLLVVLSNNTYQWRLQDLPNPNPWVDRTFSPPSAAPPPLTPAPLAWDDPGSERGRVRTLPRDIVFDLAPPAPAPAPNTCLMRFTRLGMFNNPPQTPACPSGQVALSNTPAQSTITLLDIRSGLRRTVTVTGGRIEAQK
jgi:type II secretory pathway pseudopilin PulG